MILTFLAALFVTGSKASAQIPCEYSVTVIQAPTCGFGIFPATVATGISPNGRYVVGRYQQCEKAFLDEAFVYDTETEVFMRLSRPEGTFEAIASDVNDNGWIAGTYGKDNVGNRGFVYKLHDNEWIELPPVGKEGGSVANAINNAGQVAGSRSLKGAKSNGSPFNAFIWSEKEGFTDLGVMNGPNSQAVDIAENGAVCGWTGSGIFSANSRAFVWDTSELELLPTIPSGTSSTGGGVTDSLVVTGAGRFTEDSVLLSRGFIWIDGEMVEYSPLPGDDRSAAGQVNASLHAVGTSSNSQTGLIQPVLWFQNNVLELKKAVPAEFGIDLKFARAINNSSQLAGEAQDQNGDVVAVKLDPIFGPVGDIDHNCVTNVDDLGLIFTEWGNKNSVADINNDGTVDVDDLRLVIMNWTRTK